MKRELRRAQRAFTMIEMLVVIVIAGVVLAVAAPSFRDFIGMQRLRGVTAQVIADFQFARAEAAARSDWARIKFGSNAAITCYTIYTSALPGEFCDCTRPIGTTCAGLTTAKEIRTHQVPRDRQIRLTMPATNPGGVIAFAFDHITGGIAAIPDDSEPVQLSQFGVVTRLNGVPSALVTVNQTGRITMCAIPGSRLQEAAC